MAKKPSYKSLLKKAIAKANPAAAKMRKKKRLEASAKKMSNKMTSPEKIFVGLMNEIGVEFESQKVVGEKIFDFYIPSKNLIVEINGDYWHGNSLIYESEDLNKVQKRNIKNDKFKDILAKGRGFELEVVWEFDLNNNYEEQKNRFKKLLK